MGSHFRARRGLRALVAATIVSTALFGATAATNSAGAAAAAPTNIQRAQRGAQWLANQIKNNGGFLKNFGAADPVDTAYAVIGMRSVGIDKHASNLAIVWLKRNFDTKIQLSGQ